MLDPMMLTWTGSCDGEDIKVSQGLIQSQSVMQMATGKNTSHTAPNTVLHLEGGCFLSN